MTIEGRITEIEKNQLKLADLVERLATTLGRTLKAMEILVTKLQPTTRNENATIQKEMQ